MERHVFKLGNARGLEVKAAGLGEGKVIIR